MPLQAGARLGPYEVLGFLGAGGMGEVYSARDTRLDRTVALSMMAVAVIATPRLSVGKPASLFTGRYAFGTPARHYDVTPDGRHFVLVRGEEPATARVTRLVLVQNWFTELTVKVPVK